MKNSKHSKIFVAGHKGLVGSAVLRKLQKSGYTNIITKNRNELDLLNQEDTLDFFMKEKPKYVFLCAAKVGGIIGNNTYPAEYIYQNLMIATNIIHSAYLSGVRKLLNMGSTCIYPKNAPQPMKEDALLTGELEKTNEGYAIAKIAAIKLCTYYNKQYNTNYLSVMPQNQYGIGDNFNMQTAHLLPMVIRRFHLSKLLKEGNFNAIKKDLSIYKLGWDLDEKINLNNNVSIEKALNEVGAYKDKVVMWGDGNVYRELMSSDDTADCCVYLMENKDVNDIGEFVNIGAGQDILLSDLFELVKKIVNYDGKIEYDTTKPNGTYRKAVDITRLNDLGWRAKIGLEEGIKKFYEWYISL